MIVLGTVKIGRNQGVKYPNGEGAPLPSDEAVQTLIEEAIKMGVNTFDTAPAYGTSEERLGKALRTIFKKEQRSEYFLSTKVGEKFESGKSTYDFSEKSILTSLERSLHQLNTNYVDMLWLHLPRGDAEILKQKSVLDALIKTKTQGLAKRIGASTLTIEGGLLATQVSEMDALMVSYNLSYKDEWPVIAEAAKKKKSVWIKKGLISGHLTPEHSAENCLRFLLSTPEIQAIIVGTQNPVHLREAQDLASKYSLDRT